VTEEALRDILQAARTIAVVGLSPKPTRPSHGVARYLRDAGYQIVPVNPGHSTILGEKSYPTLTVAAADHTIDIVDVFRRSEFVGAIVDEAIGLQSPPRLIWLAAWGGGRRGANAGAGGGHSLRDGSLPDGRAPGAGV